jgi:hypothetical protein
LICGWTYASLKQTAYSKTVWRRLNLKPTRCPHRCRPFCTQHLSRACWAIPWIRPLYNKLREREPQPGQNPFVLILGFAFHPLTQPNADIKLDLVLFPVVWFPSFWSAEEESSNRLRLMRLLDVDLAVFLFFLYINRKGIIFNGFTVEASLSGRWGKSIPNRTRSLEAIFPVVFASFLYHILTFLVLIYRSIYIHLLLEIEFLNL